MEQQIVYFHTFFQLVPGDLQTCHVRPVGVLEQTDMFVFVIVSSFHGGDFVRRLIFGDVSWSDKQRSSSVTFHRSCGTATEDVVD
jgi:hypothetical protein